MLNYRKIEVGDEKIIAGIIRANPEKLHPAMFIAYAGMVLLILTSALAVLTNKTFLPRRIFIFHMIVFQIIFVLIPDFRQALGAEISTWDFILSQ